MRQKHQVCIKNVRFYYNADFVTKGVKFCYTHVWLHLQQSLDSWPDNGPADPYAQESPTLTLKVVSEVGLAHYKAIPAFAYGAWGLSWNILVERHPNNMDRLHSGAKPLIQGGGNESESVYLNLASKTLLNTPIDRA
ncbi:MAG TPA: hypothetical protein VE954_24295 [Oligoflexus sp.]|uniref:hypothetical protein n=1 Tax=Oligoflexus sp. TaxID=1971216 RepID=UPI002D6A832B|nr:hypothetical protein [Oligoflexus sp.]HYX36236.1 hypothetical protein [Oligoflexus sp.]